uniref:Uncharacterized protein n=1 Tax=Sphaerodactylus townsendi TaxID=933632 RepID=A0ACB8EXW4_9SAUR
MPLTCTLKVVIGDPKQRNTTESQTTYPILPEQAPISECFSPSGEGGGGPEPYQRFSASSQIPSASTDSKSSLFFLGGWCICTIKLKCNFFPKKGMIKFSV